MSYLQIKNKRRPKIILKIILSLYCLFLGLDSFSQYKEISTSDVEKGLYSNSTNQLFRLIDLEFSEMTIKPTDIQNIEEIFKEHHSVFKITKSPKRNNVRFITSTNQTMETLREHLDAYGLDIKNYTYGYVVLNEVKNNLAQTTTPHYRPLTPSEIEAHVFTAKQNNEKPYASLFKIYFLDLSQITSEELRGRAVEIETQLLFHPLIKHVEVNFTDLFVKMVCPHSATFDEIKIPVYNLDLVIEDFSVLTAKKD